MHLKYVYKDLLKSLLLLSLLSISGNNSASMSSKLIDFEVEDGDVGTTQECSEKVNEALLGVLTGEDIRFLSDVDYDLDESPSLFRRIDNSEDNLFCATSSARPAYGSVRNFGRPSLESVNAPKNRQHDTPKKKYAIRIKSFEELVYTYYFNSSSDKEILKKKLNRSSAGQFHLFWVNWNLFHDRF